MKKTRLFLITFAALMLCSCAQPQNPASAPSYTDSSESRAQTASSQDSRMEHLRESEASDLPQSADLQASGDTTAPSTPWPDVEVSEPIEATEPPEATDTIENREPTKAAEATEDGKPTEAQSLPKPPQQIPEASFNPDDAAPYSGQPYAVVGDNTPYFSQEKFTTGSFALYSELDELGRCGTAYACVGLDLMPTQERGTIGNIRPTGWHTVKYNDIIDGNYLYNRCHLIGYLLCGENANEKNLITGTRYLNVQGMLPFETTVADYVEDTGNHVLYRVTPIFQGENLLASGVLMEAESVEDGGQGVSFCVYVYNVQPGITIDYATGESAIAMDAQAPEPIVPTQEPAPESTPPTQEPTTESTAPTQEPTKALPEQSAQDSQTQTSQDAPAPPTEPAVSQEEPPQQTAYILNTNTKKFHYPSCRSVKQMKEKNKQDYTGSRDDVISMGYDPCKNCNP